MSSWSGSSDAWVCELISFPVSLLAMMRDPQPSNLKPPHSSNIQLFTISCLPEICVFLVNVKIMQQESFMLNSEVMIYVLFFSLKGFVRCCRVEGYIELSCMTERLLSNISRLNCGNISLD